MKHTYNITGMTCNNCKQKITTALLSIPEITGAEITLDTGMAEISMNAHVQTSVMQQALEKIGDYKISMDTDASMQSLQKNKNHFKDLTPLFVIIGAILIFSIITTVAWNHNFAFGMRMFMGGFFTVFGVLKILRLKDFAVAYQQYDILAMRSNTYAHAYPFIELILGLLYFTNQAPLLTNIITIIIMGIGAVGVYRKLHKKEEIPCACLGTVFKVPMTWVTLIEDLLMVVMAGIMLVLI